MTLSRKAMRPAQTNFLLDNGVLPVSIDYRLCPEVNLIDGPIADTLSAYEWIRTALPALARTRGIVIDLENIIAVGWSTGGQLAMTTAWTTRGAGIPPPRAILSFYAPTDFESGDLDTHRADEYPQRTMRIKDIIKALPTKPVRKPCCKRWLTAADYLFRRSPTTIATSSTTQVSAGCDLAILALN